MTMRRVLAILFLTYYLVGVEAVRISESSLSSDDEETIEISDEDDTYSLEELTTVSNSINNVPLTLPVQQQKQQILYEVNGGFAIEKQIATVLEMITQTSSPLLMKLIAPSASDSTESAFVDISSQRPLMLKESSDDSSEAESETLFVKKPRLLFPKHSHAAVDRSKSADSDISDNSMEDTTTISDIEVENNETNIDIAEEITTTVSPPISSTSKRPPKNIEIFKKRPNELLQIYVEDGHLRSPIAALVDKKSNPLNKAKKLWKAALRPNSLLDILVVSYDSEGIKSTYNLTNTKAMMTTLDKVREENVTDQESKTYYSIIRTGQLIPFDSAIFLSTDDLPNDTEHQLQASMFLLKKRIRVSFMRNDTHEMLSEIYIQLISLFFFCSFIL